jgi:hypothetical protein
VVITTRDDGSSARQTVCFAEVFDTCPALRPSGAEAAGLAWNFVAQPLSAALAAAEMREDEAQQRGASAAGCRPRAASDASDASAGTLERRRLLNAVEAGGDHAGGDQSHRQLVSVSITAFRASDQKCCSLLRGAALYFDDGCGFEPIDFLLFEHQRLNVADVWRPSKGPPPGRRVSRGEAPRTVVGC